MTILNTLNDAHVLPSSTPCTSHAIALIALGFSSVAVGKDRYTR